MSFDQRVKKIELIEDDILTKASALMEAGSDVYRTDLFVLGAAKRVLSVSAGFRRLIVDRNFTCCASLLRMQIDTAARINALRFVADRELLCGAVMEGKRFDKQKDANGNVLRDSYIISKLSENFPWVEDVYKETSGFIHLSERHIFSSIAKVDAATRTVHFSISSKDPERPDEGYFEILDAFYEANKMAGTLILGYVTSRKMRIDPAELRTNTS